MSHLDILLPFVLPPAEHATDLLRSCKTPALASLLARAKCSAQPSTDGFSAAMPHEIWLSKQFELIQDAAVPDRSPPIAHALLRKFGISESEGTWFILQPVHFHIARDHLVLTDLRQLQLSEQESRVLFDTSQQLFSESKYSLIYGDARTWFVRADDWVELRTTTPESATGHNVDIWLPTGPGEREWRKMHNELQMHWHIHPLNEQREARGDKPINAAWLWGRSLASNAPTSAYGRLYNFSGCLRAFAADDGNPKSAEHFDPLMMQDSSKTLAILDDLSAPALTGDWGRWLEAMHALETRWFAPLYSALSAKKLRQLRLIMSHNTHLAEFSLTPLSLKKFWMKPSLSRLMQYPPR